MRASDLQTPAAVPEGLLELDKREIHQALENDQDLVFSHWADLENGADVPFPVDSRKDRFPTCMVLRLPARLMGTVPERKRKGGRSTVVVELDVPIEIVAPTLRHLPQPDRYPNRRQKRWSFGPTDEA